MFGYIYFAQLRLPGHANGPVKIGHTTTKRINKTLRELKANAPYGINLLGITLWTDERKDLEAELHTHFSNQRLEGSWFSWSEELGQLALTSRDWEPFKQVIAHHQEMAPDTTEDLEAFFS